jgi:hypothetical protein
MANRPSLRESITWQVLEAAEDAGDAAMIALCRRYIVSIRRGERDPATFASIKAFAA